MGFEGVPGAGQELEIMVTERGSDQSDSIVVSQAQRALVLILYVPEELNTLESS
jgi:hypothetical protein